MREAALSELGSAPRLGVDSRAGGSETRSMLNSLRHIVSYRKILPELRSALQ